MKSIKKIKEVMNNLKEYILQKIYLKRVSVVPIRILNEVEIKDENLYR